MARDPRYERSEAVTEVRRDERPPPPPWWQEHWWVFLVVLLLIVGAIILFFVFAGDDEDEAADRPTVPDVTGLQEAEARERLQAGGFAVEIVRQPSEDVEEGVVFSQVPGAGSRLAEGQTVQINVSTGPEEVVTETVTETETQAQTQTETVEEPAAVEMPDVVGESYADASAALIDAGLYPDGVAVPGEEPGVVVAQNPDPGTEVEEGTQVRLNVSTGGGELPQQEVPDVTGPTLEEAYARCVDAQFTCRIVLRDAPSQEEVGEVIDQEPAAGATAEQWSQITLALGR